MNDIMLRTVSIFIKALKIRKAKAVKERLFIYHALTNSNHNEVRNSYVYTIP